MLAFFVATGILQQRGRPPEPEAVRPDSKQAVLRVLRTHYHDPEVVEWHGPTAYTFGADGTDVYHVRTRTDILRFDVRDGKVVVSRMVDGWPGD
jgi:hypothetical protein